MAESQLQVGAQKERDAWRAWLRRIEKKVNEWPSGWDAIDVIEEGKKFFEGRTKRYNRKPGGLGSRKVKG
jgi:hypothetical protein